MFVMRLGLISEGNGSFDVKELFNGLESAALIIELIPLSLILLFAFPAPKIQPITVDPRLQDRIDPYHDDMVE
jgi:hypothetical protein